MHNNYASFLFVFFGEILFSGRMARITINTSNMIAAAAKVRARGKFQSVSKYVEQLIDQDLKSPRRPAGLVEEEQAPYGEPTPKEPKGGKKL